MKKKLIYISLFLFNINYILFNTLNITNNIKNGIRLLAAGLLLISIIFNKKIIKFNKIDIVWIFILFISLFSLNFNDKVLNFGYIIFLLIISKDISMETILKKSFIFSLVGLILIIFFLKLALIQNIQYTVGTRTRSTFGFKNVNAFSGFIYSLSILFMITREKIKLHHVTFSIVFVYILYQYTDSRTNFYTFIIFIICYFILDKFIKTKIYLKFRTFFNTVIIAIANLPVLISMFSPIIYKISPKLDILTSYRLRINTNYIYNNSIVNFIFGGSNLYDVDNGFLTLTFSLGVIFLLFSLYLINLSILILIGNKKINYVAFIISFMYFNMFEALMVRPEISISICFWIIIYKSIFQYKQENQRETNIFII